MVSISLIVLGIAGIVATAAIALMSLWLAAGSSELAGLIVLASFSVAPALILAGCRSIALGHQAWWLVTVEKVFGSTVRLIAIVAMALTGVLDIFWATVTMSVTSFVGVAVYAVLPFASQKDRIPSAELVTIKMLLSYGARIWLGSLTGILLIRVSQIIMVPLSGPYELGLFVVAGTLSEAALIFNAAVSTVIFSQESRETNDERLAATTRISTLVTFVLATAIGVIGLWAVPFFFGDEFALALPTLWVLLAAVVLGNPGSVAGQGLNARKRPGLRSASLALALIINVAAMILLVPTLGSMGAALSQLLGNVVAGGMNIMWLKKKFGLSVTGFLRITGTDINRLIRAIFRRRA